MKRKIKKFVKDLYDNLPLRKDVKVRIKNNIYKTFSFILKNTDMYKVWHEQYLINIEYCNKVTNDLEKQNYTNVESIYKQYIFENFKKSSTKSTEFVDDDVNLNINLKDEDIKLISFYLPQFHPFKENNDWWGAGFTEWTNVTKAMPQFIGHNQPQLPIDVGFYDARMVETQKRQIELAKKYGIYGFCFHHYWFSGKRLMEKPVDVFLENKEELNFPFCLCWANENWTRRWDGQDNDVLISQKYTLEDGINFIKDLEKYIRDNRYIKIKNKPIIIVYRPQIIPNVSKVFDTWREYCRKSGIGEIYLIGVNSFGFDNPLSLGMDAGVEFPPHTTKCPEITEKFNIINSDFNGQIFDLEYFIKEKKYLTDEKYKLFKCISPSWDNTARKPNSPSIFLGSNPRNYARWLDGCIEYTRANFDKDEQLVFINAWNEWAEGAHLEPDRKYGYAYLQETGKSIIRDRKKNYNDNRIIYVSHDAHAHGAQILSLNIMKYLKEEYDYEVYLILKNGGPLKSEFNSLATDMFCMEDLNQNFEKLHDWIFETGIKKAICNTVVSGDLLAILNSEGVQCISLIHEMENVIREYSCEKNLELISENAKAVVFASSYVKRSAEKIITIKAEKVKIKPQGLYFLNPYIDNMNIKDEMKKKYNIEENDVVVIGSGYGDFRKGIDLFVKVAIETIKLNENVIFLWIGKIDFKMENDLLESIKYNKFEKKIIFAGFQNDSREYFKYFSMADLFLLTSREDPFPSVVMEAMYSKLPVLAFKDGGGYVDIINDENGKLVDFENTTQMALEVLKYLSNTEQIKLSGEKTHQYIKSRFDFKSYVNYLLNLFE